MELCKHVETTFVPSGAILFRPGQLDDSIYVIKNGRLKVYIMEPVRTKQSHNVCIVNCKNLGSLHLSMCMSDETCGIVMCMYMCNNYSLSLSVRMAVNYL